MSKAKEKAEELVAQFRNHTPILKGDVYYHAKECALICVDELIEEAREFCDDNHHHDRMNFFHAVKEEIRGL